MFLHRFALLVCTAVLLLSCLDGPGSMHVTATSHQRIRTLRDARHTQHAGVMLSVAADVDADSAASASTSTSVSAGPPMALLAVQGQLVPSVMHYMRILCNLVATNTPEPIGRATPATITTIIGGAPAAFTYTLDGAGRVLTAEGDVVTGGGTNVHDRADRICDAMYFQHIGAQRPPNIHTGHIIGAALGGSNTEMLNFMPQDALSNSGQGTWKRMEDLIRDFNPLITPLLGGAACRIRIHVSLAYAGGALSFVPAGGNYAVSMPQACGNQFQTTVGALPVAGLTQAQKVLLKWLNAATVGPGGALWKTSVGTNFVWTQPWVNGAGDSPYTGKAWLV